MNVLTNAQLLVLVVAIFLTVMAIMHMIGEIRTRRAQERKSETAASQREHAERETKRRRDHQLNHGRRVFNWLKENLKQYDGAGILLTKIENNGNKFSIHIDMADSSMQGRSPIVQISYDFVGQPEPYLGHIHYGAYGADILFWVGDHSPFNGLDRLVLQEVDVVVERRLART